MILLALLLAASGPTESRMPWGNGQSKPEDLEVSLVTFGPGDDITEWFGHSALVVDDKVRRVSRLYNYGEFSFDEKTVMKYVLQALTFHVGERGVEATYKRYAANNRSIHIAVLKLTPEERAKISLYLANNALPENANYIYDHYIANCATRPRDIIDDAVGGALKAKAQGPARLTLRGHTRRMTAVNPLLEAAIDFVENHSVDDPIKVWDEAFLPDELERQVRAAGLMESERVYFEAKRAPPRQDPPTYWPVMLLLGLGVGAVPFALRKRRTALLLVTAGLAGILGFVGLLLVVAWFVTAHEVMHKNVNLFIANPLLLGISLASLVAIKKPALDRILARAWIGYEAIAVVGAVVALVVGQNVWQSYALCFPIVAGCAASIFLAGRQQR